MKRAVFLDRDGVLNKALIKEGKPYSPEDMSQVEIIDGVFLALEKFRKLEFELVVVTNQPNIARGIDEPEFINEVNEFLKSQLSLENFFVCPHDDSDYCECRKPMPGLLIRASLELNIDLTNSFMVGDRWRDIEAGQKAGATCIFIDYGYDETQPKKPFIAVGSLLEASSLIERNLWTQSLMD